MRSKIHSAQSYMSRMIETMAYHENVKFGIYMISYYDTIEEIPDCCLVSFPDGSKRAFSLSEMQKLALTEEWYVIVNDCNYGVCDHWISIPFRQWLEGYFPQLIRYEGKNKETRGYNRKYPSVSLTKEKNYHKSEVWNS